MLGGSSMPATPAITHLRILASAGSGKTWALSTRYLQLVRRGARPNGILASTFTRLAAGEIRDRILARVADAVDDPDACEHLRRDLEIGSLSRQDAVALLAGLAANMHDMNIRTLDSFFASIVQSFPLEVDIPLGCRIVDDDEGGALRIEAIRRMLDEQDPQPLVETLRLLTRGDPERGVMKSIDRVVETFYSIFLETEDHAWESLPEMREQPIAIVADLVEDLCGLEVPGRSQRLDAHRKACDYALDRSWRNFLGVGFARAIAVGKSSYYGRIEPHVRAVYEPLVLHARNSTINLYRHWNLATRDLLRRFARQYDALKRERGVMTFQDLTQALDRAGCIGTLDDICYRLDRRIEHVLLDEFQDTSIPQWRAIAEPLRELVSDETTGRTLFCVGDLKQSIYEWRDASPEILDNLPELLFGKGAGETQLPSKILEVSWRSARPVIDAVNAVFGSMADAAPLEKSPSVAEAWSRAFTKHAIAKRNEGLAGYVELRIVDPDAGDDECNSNPLGLGDDGIADEDDSRDDEADGDAGDGRAKACRITASIRLARELNQAAPHLSIGILARSNALANDLLFRMQHLSMPASGPGGGPLTDVAPVNVILDLLQMAECPEDTAAAFHVQQSPLGDAIGLTNFRHAGERRTVARSIRRETLERGFGPLIARLVAVIAAKCSPREWSRLIHLVGLAESVDATGSRDVASLIKVVDSRQVADPRPAPIQVLTIHKAKGLEFDAVILPELGSSLEDKSPKIAYEREEITGRITRITRGVRKEVRELLADIKSDFDIEPLYQRMADKHARESLCMLYVAMTRARQALYMMIDPPRFTKDGAVNKQDLRTLAGLVWTGLSPGGRAPKPGTVIPKGDEAWWRHGDASKMERAVPPQGIAPQSIAVAPPRTDRHKAMLTLSPSQEGRRAVLRQELQPIDRDNIDRGVAMHALFEQIEWLDDFAIGDADLRSLVAARMPRRDGRWVEARVREFRNAMKQQGIRDALRAPPRLQSNRLRVWRERPFARLTESGLQQGVIDRLEVEFDDRAPRRAVRARLFDYKTDAVTVETLDAAALKYSAQIAAYRDAVAETFAIDSAAIECILLFAPAGLTWRGMAGGHDRTNDDAHSDCRFRTSLFE